MMDAKNGARHTLFEQVEPRSFCVPCSGDLNPEVWAPDTELNRPHILLDLPTGIDVAAVKFCVEPCIASCAYAAVGWGKLVPDVIANAR